MAVAIAVVPVAVKIATALANYRGGSKALGALIGTVIGSLFVPSVAVLFSTFWERANRSQSTRFKVFIFSSSALLALSFAARWPPG